MYGFAAQKLTVEVLDPDGNASGVSNAQAIALDLGADLYVLNGNNTVTVYTPPYTGSPVATISSGINVGAGWEFGVAFYQH